MERIDGRMRDVIEDAAMEAQRGFSVGDVRLALRPPSLGATLLASRIAREAGIDIGSLASSPLRNAVDIASRKRTAVAEMLAHYTLAGRDAHFDAAGVREAAGLIATLDDQSLAELLLVAVGMDRTAEMLRAAGLDGEAELRSRLAAAKSRRNVFDFGGATLFGRVLDAACSRYGWTVEYAVWGVSWAALRMMLSDAATSVFMGEDDMKRYKARGGAPKPGGGGFAGFLAALHTIKGR